MQGVTTIGLDIAKSVFQVHGVDALGKVVIPLDGEDYVPKALAKAATTWRDLSRAQKFLQVHVRKGGIRGTAAAGDENVFSELRPLFAGHRKGAAHKFLMVKDP